MKASSKPPPATMLGLRPLDPFDPDGELGKQQQIDVQLAHMAENDNGVDAKRLCADTPLMSLLTPDNTMNLDSVILHKVRGLVRDSFKTLMEDLRNLDADELGDSQSLVTHATAPVERGPLAELQPLRSSRLLRKPTWRTAEALQPRMQARSLGRAHSVGLSRGSSVVSSVDYLFGGKDCQLGKVNLEAPDSPLRQESKESLEESSKGPTPNGEGSFNLAARGPSVSAISSTVPMGPEHVHRSKTIIRKHEKLETGLAAIVSSCTFELVFAVLIAINTAVMCLEAQYEGYDAAHAINFKDGVKTGQEAWPGAHGLFTLLEMVFGIAFTVEVAIKLVAFRARFFASAWNHFDTLIIVIWLFKNLSSLDIGINPLILRLARLGRLMRLLRFVRQFQVFDVLWLLIESVRACASVFLWSVLLLFMCMIPCTLFLNYVIQPMIVDPSIPAIHTRNLYLYFGTFSRGLLSMYEITMGNYVPISRTMHETVSEWFLPLVLSYRCVVSFALIKVISAIFLCETLKAAQSNDEVMIMQRERAMSKHVRKISQLFKEADESGDGQLSLEEFQGIMGDERVRIWLAAQELEVEDVRLVFDMVDDGKGMLTAEELVRGFARLKGAARSMDLLSLQHCLEKLEADVKHLNPS
eukprot:TRINITY_DN55611_c0_g1_i1.p1 TRINITY_DN55611_c0_g1~~TRINITY_DN55611_c0_g1_i1.p1  ORF type:complete len:640 (-),score=119.40 TRINITY_DN55611_c0_g1_i1:85-2004(-)